MLHFYSRDRIHQSASNRQRRAGSCRRTFLALQVAEADYNLIQNLDFVTCRGFVQYVTKDLEECDEGVILKNPLLTVNKYCWKVIEHLLAQVFCQMCAQEMG